MSHFTAVIEVHEVDEGEEPKVDQYNSAKLIPGRPRIVKDVARIVVRADDLDRLKEKIAAHADLID